MGLHWCAFRGQWVSQLKAFRLPLRSAAQRALASCAGTAETDFEPQLRDLSDTMQVVSFDPRGYGKSRPPMRDFPVDFYQQDADDAAAVMKALGHAEYNVLGWSDGAISALLLAASQRAAVGKLVIFGGNAYFTKDDIDAFEAVRDIETSWSKRMKATHQPVYGDDLQPMWSKAVDAWSAIYHERGGDICQEQAKGLACPTLVLHGAKDPICLQEHAEWFGANIPGATLRILPDGKHNLHLRFADEVNGMIRAFVDGREVPQPAPPAPKL
jgi:valacyclovir hydrolase